MRQGAMDEPERRLNNLAFHQSPQLLGVVTFDGTLKILNASWEKALGYPLDALVGRKLATLADPNDRATVLRLINPRLAASDPAPIELSFKCSNGTYKAFVWERRPVVAEQTMFISGRDITEKKKIEVTANLKLYALYVQERKPNPIAGQTKR
jgi:two-component system NtrC family sensor kinase